MTQACAITCGNGNVEGTEACDDGNLAAGDGCSPTCTLEAGFMCTNTARPDTETCTSGECLKLPVIYRDFKSEKETGGHPDFFYLGAPVANPVQITGVTGQPGAVTFNKRYCVSNSGGPAKQNDSTARCWGLAQANLGPNGKPVFNMARTGGTNVRLPVHRLEPQRQRRPRARLRRRDDTRVHGARLRAGHGGGQQRRRPLVQGPGAHRRPARRASSSGSWTARSRATSTWSARWSWPRPATGSFSSRARRTRSTAASSRSIRRISSRSSAARRARAR